MRESLLAPMQTSRYSSGGPPTEPAKHWIAALPPAPQALAHVPHREIPRPPGNQVRKPGPSDMGTAAVVCCDDDPPWSCHRVSSCCARDGCQQKSRGCRDGHGHVSNWSAWPLGPNRRPLGVNRQPLCSKPLTAVRLVALAIPGVPQPPGRAPFGPEVHPSEATPALPPHDVPSGPKPQGRYFCRKARRMCIALSYSCTSIPSTSRTTRAMTWGPDGGCFTSPITCAAQGAPGNRCGSRGGGAHAPLGTRSGVGRPVPQSARRVPECFATPAGRSPVLRWAADPMCCRAPRSPPPPPPESRWGNGAAAQHNLPCALTRTLGYDPHAEEVRHPRAMWDFNYHSE